MTASLNRRLFVEMLREEWRMHADLFGGVRFAAFPLFVLGLGGGAVWLLTTTSVATVDALILGVHALAFAFGLQTGTTAFLGRDAMRNLLGDMTLLLFTARTLPVSQRRLLAVFLVKDAVYYSGLFMLPMALSFAPAVAAGLLAPVEIAVLWGTATATFLLGVTVTFAGVALSTRGVSGRVVALALAIAVGVAFAAGVDLVRFTPYGVYAGASVLETVAVVAAIPVLGVLGVATYDANYSAPARTAADAYTRWRSRLPFADDAVTAKTLLDLSRSSGGVFKVAFSGAILLAVGVFLLELAGEIAGVDPSPGVTLGAILGLSAFTTYNWLTQFDSLDEYRLYPLDVADVLRAKRRAFLLVGLPTGLAFYALALAFQFASVGDALAGVVVHVGIQTYLFGVTVYLAGFSPNEFLFDTVLFAAFTLAVAAPLVPIVVAGFVVSAGTPVVLAGIAVSGVVLAFAGGVLVRRATPKWERLTRT
ncbi:hypothetical protein G9C85_16500 [Halorubellus sp. JP-L1]|uniref:hypothetical protein n=1 Tax=Halorubellus sp. JP-L1 TaxID=2715753 RepID=UPI00140C34EE|nr:hypothetical protein [Halorubellus sp. JP-L1]NHN43219.1 hypothetical protein [Halorubellus sp. JP-L1]